MSCSGPESRSYGVTDELRTVCAELLNNADVCLSLDDENDAVVLTFLPACQECEVVFECSGLQKLRLVKHPQETCGFFVGETHVEAFTSASDKLRLLSQVGSYPEDQLAQELFSVRTLPGIELEIICTRFAWYRRPPEMRSLLFGLRVADNRAVAP
jgi:hypothetical protein